MTISTEQGLSNSLEEACFSSTTVCLPFVVAAVIAPLVSPSRMVGVWIQVGYLGLFLFSLYYYLSRVRELSRYVSTLVCLAFCCLSCIYYENGGISDFRMDFGLCMTFGMTAVWYLISISQPLKRHFCLLGLAAGLCCLARATAPVYLLTSFAPLLTYDWIMSKEKRQLIRGIGIALLFSAAGSGWFFVLNFEYLHYYYAVWNTDANAKIPFSEAWNHVKLARRCFGEPLTLLLVLWASVLFANRKSSGEPKNLASANIDQRGSLTSLFARCRVSGIDFRIAWIGAAPLVLLVARQAGLNPFVAMPAVIGLSLFLLIPIAKTYDRNDNPKLARLFAICLIVCLAIAGARGWRRHQERAFNSMAAYQEIVETMLQDSQSRGIREVQFAVMQSSELNSDSLYSTLLFDRPDAQPRLNHVLIGDSHLLRIKVFSKSALADWDEVPGASDDEKIADLIFVANQQAN